MSAVIIGEVAGQDMASVPLAEHEDMVQTLASDRTDEPFREGVLPGRSGGRDHLPDPHVVDAPSEGLAVDRVSIPK